jgi:hypothetical protein
LSKFVGEDVEGKLANDRAKMLNPLTDEIIQKYQIKCYDEAPQHYASSLANMSPAPDTERDKQLYAYNTQNNVREFYVVEQTEAHTGGIFNEDTHTLTVYEVEKDFPTLSFIQPLTQETIYDFKSI